MASIERRTGGWRVAWRDGGRGTKKHHSPGIYATKPEAMEAKELVEAQQAARRRLRQGVLLRFPELLERWRLSRLALGRHPIFTQRAVDLMTAHIDEQEWTTVASVTPAAVEAWRSGSPRRIRAGSYLGAFLRWCRDYAGQPVDAQALIALRPPAGRYRPKPPLLTAKQVRQAEQQASAVSRSCGLLVHCLATYGWRPITAAKLTVGDIVDGHAVTKVKGGDVIRHPLLAVTQRRLAPFLKRPAEAPLFVDPRTQQAFTEVDATSIPQWARWILDVPIYDLKRYAISSMLARGIPVQDVALFTGHRTLGQVLKYARTNEERARKALRKMGDTGGHRASRNKPKRKPKHRKAS